MEIVKSMTAVIRSDGLYSIVVCCLTSEINKKCYKRNFQNIIELGIQVLDLSNFKLIKEKMGLKLRNRANELTFAVQEVLEEFIFYVSLFFIHDS